MELKVFKDTVTGYGGKWETRLELPVETEILIPDYLPAVFKIIKCRIEPVVLQNRAAAGRWLTEGYLRCTVYYESDAENGKLCRIEQKFPFEKTIELPAGSYWDGPALVWGEPEYCNCRAISEHRMDLRGAYILCAAIPAYKDCELLAALADCGIEQRSRTLQGLYRKAAEEKTITSECSVPAPDTGELMLDISGCFLPQSYTLQNGQVNCKGSLQMQLCSRAADSDEIMVRSKEIAIQQTVEMGKAIEGDGCIFWGEVQTCTMTTTEDSREPTLNVTWKLHLELWRSAEYKVVADAYSTLCETQTVQTSCKLLQKSADFDTRLEATLEDDLPQQDLTIKGCFVTLGALTAVPVEPEKGPAKAVPQPMLRLAGKGTAHLICADERGELSCYDKAFTWQPEGIWPGVTADACPCLYGAVTRVSSSKNGAQVRLSVEIQLTGALFQAVTHEALCEVELGEEYTDTAQEPALYLYYAKEGEAVFDIAKRYHARAKDLAAANHLEPSGEAAGESPRELTVEAGCLLIPAAL